MKLSSAKKIILSVGLLIATTLIIVIFVILPTINSIKDITKQTAQLRANIEERYQESLRTRLTKKKIEDIQANSKDFGNYLYTNHDPLQFIEMMESIAVKNSVSQNINNSNLDSIKSGGFLNMTLSFDGTYQNVLNHIYTLETLNYFFKIHSIRLTPNGSDNANAIITISLYVN
ncbi:MAG: hypothetical protein COU31_01295 [Candidatus Magasanikbacteria bacterium CG10_big_fil_rev_8_21_14_0_10_40_10]|uniref:Uncharacterized protein n=1 Tax=Candidatus Magasanikbacteria bacterium CG10_big_fil_rev_8_21_14_0_10_40_10 TaxID=1974648 RepID=A0A2M6W4M4_9BACT|nr:MAG: hypothetical protein COU31_01295 [Candidatus Magasanikbacteria bacterium CG10_big_fil_rev_8_21_14_0_10_40_10]